jgi:hypothetical protein
LRVAAVEVLSTEDVLLTLDEVLVLVAVPVLEVVEVPVLEVVLLVLVTSEPLPVLVLVELFTLATLVFPSLYLSILLPLTPTAVE